MIPRAGQLQDEKHDSKSDPLFSSETEKENEKEKEKELDESSVSSQLNKGFLDLSTDAAIDTFIDGFELLPEHSYDVVQKKNARIEKSKNEEEEKKKQSAVHKKLSEIVEDVHDEDEDVPNYHADLGDGVAQLYEKQPRGSNNCYACSAAALYNQHLINKGQQPANGGALNQYDFRSYKPQFIDFAEFQRRNPNSEEPAFEKEKQQVRQYTREESKERGNVFALADKFLEMDSNLCVNDMTFDLSNITDAKFKKMKALFLSQVKKVLDTGEAISFYQFSTNHYQTIIGINGDHIRYLDSTGSNSHEVHEVPVKDFFFKSGVRVSLNWLSEKKTPQEMTGEFSNLEYDQQAGKYRVRQPELPNNDIAHTHGIDVQKTSAEKDALHFDAEIKDLVSLGTYIPQGDNIVHQDRPIDDDYDVIVTTDETSQVTTITRKIPKDKINDIHLPNGIQIDPQVIQAINPVQDDGNQQEVEKPKEKEEEKPVIQDLGGGEVLVHEAVAGNVVQRVVVVDKQVQQQAQKKAIEQPAEKKEQKTVKTANLPEMTYAVTQALNFRTCSLIFTDGYDTKGRSASFMALREAATDCRDIIDGITAGRFALTEANYARYMRLYTATMRYINEHRSPTFSAGKERLQAAEQMRDAMRRVSRSILQGSGNPLDPPPAVGKVEDEEKKYAKENYERLKAYYRQYCQKIDEDLVASDDEKLMRKWDVFKCNERDIIIHLKSLQNQGKKLSDEDNFMLNEYHTIRTQVQLRDRIKGISKQADSMNKDDKLSNEQIQALSRLDTWIIRNTRNGGFFRMFDAAISDRTDIAAKILSMSRRQRLYMYYLVETRERVEPTMEGFIKSQTEYIPDLNKFKDRMIATKWKMHLRVSGSYIYWNKLTEAMAIVNQGSAAMNVAEQFFSANDTQTLAQVKDTKAKTVSKSKPESKEEKKESEKAETKEKNVFTEPKQCMEELLKNGLRAMTLLQFNEKNKKAKDRATKQQIEQNKAELQTLQENGQELSKQLTDSIEKMKAVKAKATSKKDDIKLITATIPGHAVSDTKIVWSAFDQFYKMSDNFKTWPSVYSGSASSINLLSRSVGVVFSLMSLYNDGMSMSGIDLWTNSLDVALNIEKTANDVTSLVGTITHSSAIKAAAPAVGIGFAIIESGIAVMKTGSLIRNSYHRHQVSKLPEGMQLSQDEEQFRQGMIRLNEKIAKRQKASTAGAAVKAVVSTTAAVLIASSVATCGVSAIAGGLALLVSWAFDAGDRKLARDIKTELFDSYFNTEEEVEKVKADFIRRNGREMNDKEKQDVVIQVRRRIAVKNNFYSPYNAAKFVAGKYATYMLDHAQKGPNEQLYISMIKALGLRFEYNKNNPEGNVPTTSDIVKKMAG